MSHELFLKRRGLSLNEELGHYPVCHLSSATGKTHVIYSIKAIKGSITAR